MRAIYLTSQRPYEIWVGEDTKEFAFGVGVPVMVIFIYMRQPSSRNGKLKNRHSGRSKYICDQYLNYLLHCRLLGISEANQRAYGFIWLFSFKFPQQSLWQKLRRENFCFLCCMYTCNSNHDYPAFG